MMNNERLRYRLPPIDLNKTFYVCAFLNSFLIRPPQADTTIVHHSSFKKTLHADGRPLVARFFIVLKIVTTCVLYVIVCHEWLC